MKMNRYSIHLCTVRQKNNSNYLKGTMFSILQNSKSLQEEISIFHCVQFDFAFQKV